MKTEYLVFGLLAVVVVCACVLAAIKVAPPDAFVSLASMIFAWLMPSPIRYQAPQVPPVGGDK